MNLTELNTTMVLLISESKAQKLIVSNLKNRRLAKGFTQSGLAARSGVPLSSLRKFEQKGQISLSSLLKLCMALGCLEEIVKSTEQPAQKFNSIDEVLHAKEPKKPQRGWRK